MIKDSGARREFESGALRDVVEGKGRCDLLPLDVLASFYHRYTGHEWVCGMLNEIESFIRTGDTRHLEEAVVIFMAGDPTCAYSPFGDIGFETMWLEVAKHFEEGCMKYGENNWRKGIPAHCYVDSAVRHLLKWLRGDRDEPHHRAVVWNLICCIWTCRYMPNLNGYSDKEVREEEDKPVDARRGYIGPGVAAEDRLGCRKGDE